MQGKNGDTYIESGSVDTMGEEESGTKGKSNIDLKTLPRVKQIAGEKLPHNTGSPAMCFVTI